MKLLIGKTETLAFFFVAVCLVGIVSMPKQAEACCSCIDAAQSGTDDEWSDALDEINDHTDEEFEEHREWIIDTLWGDNILEALLMMTEQLTAVAMQQVQIIGSFIDAWHQMQTQQIFQTLQARAHKDYHPSIGMCEFGSQIKSLAASERKSEYNAVLMSQRAQDRALGNAFTAAAAGQNADNPSRLKQFREKFCDPYDNNNGLDYICDWDQDGNPATGNIGAHRGAAPAPDRMNKDIDYVRTVAFPWTLNIDFTDNTLTEHEEEVLALASNLYGHEVFERPPAASLANDPDKITQVQKNFMDARAVIAKQSVAENSYNAITGMKAEGTAGSREFLLAVIEELGLTYADAELLMGDGASNVVNPSYYAQMEVLTKKIYQNPDFYTNLYDKPANVDRKAVALQAIGLMQKFDLFKSYLRNEASLSVLLELAVMDLQEEIENEFGRLTAGGSPGR